jgi:hypothetical protein
MRILPGPPDDDSGGIAGAEDAEGARFGLSAWSSCWGLAPTSALAHAAQKFGKTDDLSAGGCTAYGAFAA